MTKAEAFAILDTLAMSRFDKEPLNEQSETIQQWGRVAVDIIGTIVPFGYSNGTFEFTEEDLCMHLDKAIAEKDWSISQRSVTLHMDIKKVRAKALAWAGEAKDPKTKKMWMDMVARNIAEEGE